MNSLMEGGEKGLLIELCASFSASAVKEFSDSAPSVSAVMAAIGAGDSHIHSHIHSPSLHPSPLSPLSSSFLLLPRPGPVDRGQPCPNVLTIHQG